MKVLKTKKQNARFCLQRKNEEGSIYSEKLLQVNCCLSCHITVLNCTHLKNKNIGEKTILFSLTWLVAWRETVLAD